MCDSLAVNSSQPVAITTSDVTAAIITARWTCSRPALMTSRSHSYLSAHLRAESQIALEIGVHVFWLALTLRSGGFWDRSRRLQEKRGSGASNKQAGVRHVRLRTPGA